MVRVESAPMLVALLRSQISSQAPKVYAGRYRRTHTNEAARAHVET